MVLPRLLEVLVVTAEETQVSVRVQYSTMDKFSTESSTVFCYFSTIYTINANTFTGLPTSFVLRNARAITWPG